MSRVSPHTRGWTHGEQHLLGVRLGFPAHAGMDPSPTGTTSTRSRFPRTRGDGPAARRRSSVIQLVSPHTRGWTWVDKVHWSGVEGFPAHAGMDPCRWPTRCGCGRFPRTRGDGPLRRLTRDQTNKVSPHTRGWTLAMEHPWSWVEGFPAHAGMDPLVTLSEASMVGFPRTRGDGPYAQHVKAMQE